MSEAEAACGEDSVCAHVALCVTMGMAAVAEMNVAEASFSLLQAHGL